MKVLGNILRWVFGGLESVGYFSGSLALAVADRDYWLKRKREPHRLSFSLI